jgi:hypothetical protein
MTNKPVKIVTADGSNSLEELELMLAVVNTTLEWLHSDDPMLQDPGWAPLVPDAVERYEQQKANILARIDQVKQQNGNPQPITIQLNTASMAGKSELG